MDGDTGVSQHSHSLSGRSILLAVSGGIAAVESVRLCRELRRHGATVSPMMTKEATKIISPLTLSWGSGTEVISSWESSMSQLDKYDAIVVAPATRNTIAKHLNGIMDSPLMMALSAARGSKTPLVFVPSMHSDLFDDPVTGDLISSLEDEGSEVIFDDEEEGKRKQPDPVEIVAQICHIVNSRLPNRRIVAITLGANSAPIDDIRSITNTSSGLTGWTISEHLHRMGHKVTCIAGNTTKNPNFILPDIRRAFDPQKMLNQALKVATELSPDTWIFCAAVLDYIPEYVSGKIPSSQDELSVKLLPTQKHIPLILEKTGECYSIGFKLESSVEIQQLIDNASSQVDRYSMNAVFANRLEDIANENSSRAWLVESDGNTREIPDLTSLCENIEALMAS